MMVSLHKRARTTPAIRAELAESTKPVRELARQYGISEATVRKWCSRSSTEDRPHTPHRLQTHLTPTQEAIVIHLRKRLLLSLDNLLNVVNAFICDKVSRSGLDRCLRRHGVSNLHALKSKVPKTTQEGFKACQPGHIHIEIKSLPKMENESTQHYLFIAIDCVTRWLFVQTQSNTKTANARHFLDSLQTASPINITHIVTGSGQEHTDSLLSLHTPGAGSIHEFDRFYADLGVSKN
ncbi:hypothetical protein CLV44_13118 [Marinobacterium halophilum]|uniref:Integrase-like protein n=1 Tax=Marinobacterium halophilum TaxID=267374 RepID=A0A2P8EJ76_9GAMM|nr:IS481 family transposase [Marinobacterium halophilum]PSL09523.1 hypothetical protein CLV44_13118 [Marinobacterium halophilum]